MIKKMAIYMIKKMGIITQPTGRIKWESSRSPLVEYEDFFKS